ncbi:flippase-like domain-containing protein [Solirubrobacter sp. CPCC 204708]|uniref:Flippase-like domain-containing protein n=1 Tax=Solirubrobacter deserti TaxID=2282478 RepID=A0ABT4RHR4_9ACTN|nr:lysylphosphatidylglycerol synthase domain-containing protein [Solirubrobacter deserti]MBE2316480.1 flippase-like domain-containing protein [Solirubrobacter deserti]MDA0138013.1 flippase-like domain-containing protein [Solirubrobacter deserti]
MPYVLMGLSPGWLALGVVLHLLNQVARGRGWCAVIRRTSEAPPRTRDAVAAWVAGAGAGGIVSARGGDAVRVLLLARRMPGRGNRALLTGTLVAEAAGETALGLGLLALALAIGVGPDVSPGAQTGLIAAAALLTVTGAVLIGRRHAKTRRFIARVKTGCSALKSPRAYARHVLPWQLLSRVLRLAALGCFLAAFHLPATLAAVLLVTFAQCSGRIVPFSPASVGTGAAILAATFGPVTGQHVPAAQLAAFFVGTSTVLTVVGTALALVLCATQASANAGPRLVRVGRFARIRTAITAKP